MRIELQNVNTNKLHDELIEAGIMPELVESINNTTWITVKDDEESAVMLVVSKHNPSPLPKPPTEGERLSLLEQAMDDLLLGGAL